MLPAFICHLTGYTATVQFYTSFDGIFGVSCGLLLVGPRRKERSGTMIMVHCSIEADHAE